MRRGPASAADAEASRDSRGTPILLTVSLLLVSLAMGSYGLRSWERQVEIGQRMAERHAPVEPAPAAHPPKEPTVVPVAAVRLERDPEGRIRAVAGTTPPAVLIGYCESRQPAGLCDPLEVAAVNPPRVGMRLGLFRDLSRPHDIRAIRIERDPDTRRWRAGSGDAPIETFRPALRHLGHRTPIR